MDIGGLLDFDPHAESLEEVTAECQRHRDGLDGKRGPKKIPKWRTQWQKIKQQRAAKHFPLPGGDMNDNEAAAQLLGDQKEAASSEMCRCSGAEGTDGDAHDDDAAAQLLGDHKEAASSEMCRCS